MTAYNPDGPHSPDLTRQAAGELAELARYLCRATMPGQGGTGDPVDVWALLGELVTAAGRLPQVCSQLAAYLRSEQAAGRLDRSQGKSPGAAAGRAVAALSAARELAEALAAEFGAAQNAVSGLSVKESTDG